MKNKKMFFLGIALVACIAVGFWLKGCIAVDACLDSGGRWDYEAHTCEH